jgi:hypothetical protein
MVETNLTTVRLLLTHVKHIEIDSRFGSRVTIAQVAKWDWTSKMFVSVEKEGEAFVLCVCSG